MIAIAVLALATQAQPSDEELMAELERNRIDVTAQQLRNFRGRWDLNDDGTATCKTKRSSGDDDLDVLACEAIKACVIVNRDLITRRDDRKRPRAERRELRAQTKTAMNDCAGERFDLLKTEYEARALADTGTMAESNL